MSQTEKPTTTIPTRRALLAGAPVAAAAALTAGTAVNSLAVAVAASSAPDPIFVAIAAYRAAVKAYSAACEADAAGDADDEDLVHETAQAHVDTLEELLTCRPTTLPGTVALLDLLAEPDYGHEPEDTVLAGVMGWEGRIKAAAMDLPGILAETIRALIGTVPMVQRGAVEPDPIYAAIARHRGDYEEHNNKVSALDEAGTPEAEAENQRLMDVLRQAEIDMIDTEPTTIAGAAALLRYVGMRAERGPPLDQMLDASLLGDALAKIAV
jgi:hypothetical protein